MFLIAYCAKVISMLSIVIAVAVGLAIGFAVNILADVLPQYRLDDGEDDDAVEKSEEGLEITESVVESSPTPKWSPSRLGSLRYIVVNILMVAIAIYVWGRVTTPLGIGIHIFYLALFLLIAVIDIEHKLVLTIVMIPAFIFAFVEIAISHRVTLADALVGYAIGQIVVMLFYLLGGIYITIINARRNEPIREVAFGFGDVTLATFCGLIIGYPGVIWLLVLMILVGGLMGFVFLLVRLVIVRRYQAHMAIPYGPAIVIAAALMLLWGPEITYWMWGGR
jgi:leader peptidase (prepilin peptidase) / N-methyltransferase